MRDLPHLVTLYPTIRDYHRKFDVLLYCSGRWNRHNRYKWVQTVCLVCLFALALAVLVCFFFGLSSQRRRKKNVLEALTIQHQSTICIFDIVVLVHGSRALCFFPLSFPFEMLKMVGSFLRRRTINTPYLLLAIQIYAPKTMSWVNFAKYFFFGSFSLSPSHSLFEITKVYGQSLSVYPTASYNINTEAFHSTWNGCMFINLVHLVIVLRSNNPHPFLFFFIFGSFRIHFELNEIKGDRIKESLNVSDLIIFISTFIYRKSIRCWWYTRIHAFTVFPSFPKTIQ